MLPILQIGPLAIQTPGLLLLLGIWVGLTLAGKRSGTHGLKSDSLDNFVMVVLLSFALGGRLSFVLTNLALFRDNPLDIFSLNLDLFDPIGGVTAGLLAGFAYGQRRGLPFWSTLDALTPFFATMMAALGLSHLASGAAFGKETSLPWGIDWNGAVRHPSQVYESAAALFILSLVINGKPSIPAGTSFLGFVAWSAGARLFLESFRGDSTLVFINLRLDQILAWIVLALALLGLERLRKPKMTMAAAMEASEHG